MFTNALGACACMNSAAQPIYQADLCVCLHPYIHPLSLHKYFTTLIHGRTPMMHTTCHCMLHQYAEQRYCMLLKRLFAATSY